MLTRAATILLTTWSLIGLPTLCEAGGILHPCDCAQEGTGEHESDCPDDPCDSATVTQDRRPRAECVLLLFPATAVLESTPQLPSERGFEQASSCLVVVRLPYPPSDVPLRL